MYFVKIPLKYVNLAYLLLNVTCIYINNTQLTLYFNNVHYCVLKVRFWTIWDILLFLGVQL